MDPNTKLLVQLIERIHGIAVVRVDEYRIRGKAHSYIGNRSKTVVEKSGVFVY